MDEEKKEVDTEEFDEAKEIAKRIGWMQKNGMKPEVDQKLLSFDYNGTRVKLEKVDDDQLLSTMIMAIESFGLGEYDNLEVKGKTVVDVGAYDGGSAIMFALRGARRVFAFEPFPYSYELAKKNVRLNGLDDRITLVNKGCLEDGWITIDRNYRNQMYNELMRSDKGKKIEVLSLKNLVKRYKIERDARLKLDCEGCENQLILDSDEETLNRFTQISMEYHYGYKKLAKRLGLLSFNVRYSEPRKFWNPLARKENMYMGMLFAEFSLEKIMGDLIK